MHNSITGKIMLVLCVAAMMLIFSSPAVYARTMLFQDDFETGNANAWSLGSGWQIEDDRGNYVLSGNRHAFASTGDRFWRRYQFETDIKLLASASTAHLNYLENNCNRYFVGFHAGGLYLNKTYPCGTHTDLATVSDPHETDRWYTVKIIGNEGTVKVYVDGRLKIEYTDPDPLINGAVSFETLNTGYVYFDNVTISADEDTVFSENTWENTGGPIGGLGYDVRVHPYNKNVMFVTDNFAGVAKSDNAGQTWYHSNTGINVKSGLTGDAVNIFSLTIDPNDPDIIWAGTNGEGGQFGVFKSTNAGMSWQNKISGMSLGNDLVATGLVFRGFTIQEGDSDIVYAQAEVATTVNGLEFNRVKGQVYKTVDGGESWRLIWSGDNLARYLIIDPENPDILYLSTGIFDREAFNSDCENAVFGGTGVLKSTDGGLTWNPVNNGLTDLYVGALRMHPADPSILFAAAGNNACSGGYTGHTAGGLFKTTNGGAHWVKVISNDNMTTVNFSPSNPGIMYAGSASAFYKSTDQGNTWVRYAKNSGQQQWGPPGIVAGVPIDVVVDPENTHLLYANNYGGGVFRSRDGSATWESWSKGYSGAELHAVHVPSKTASNVYVIGRSGPFVSADHGNDWAGIANGEADFAEWYAIAVHPANPQIVLVSDENQGTINRSIDQGNDFTEVLRHPAADASSPDRRQGFKTIVFSASASDIVYAGLSKDSRTFETAAPAGTAIYKSQNAGMTFVPMPSIVDGHNVNQLVVDAENAGIVYAATTSGVYKTTDGASTWQHCSSLGARHIETLALDPAQPGFVIAGEGFLGSGIWISADDGLTWSGPFNQGFNSPNPYLSSIINDPARLETFFAGDLYSGVYISRDNGLTWSAFPDWQMSGLTFRSVSGVAMSRDYLYAATRGGGVFRHKLSGETRQTPLTPVVLSGTSGNHTVSAGKNERVYGTSASDNLVLESGAKAELVNFPGQNTIQIISSASLFSVSRSGATVVFSGSDETWLKIPATANAQTLIFNDKTMTLAIDGNQVKLENQVITSTPFLLQDFEKQ